jgi:hypothetical protein
MNPGIIDEISPIQRKALAKGSKFGAGNKVLGTNIEAWGIDQLQRELWRSYNLTLEKATSKTAVLIFGDAGCGKSEVVQSFAKNMTSLYPDRKYLHFTDIKDVEQMTDVIKNAKNYFVFLDLRASQLSPEQVGGVPNMPRSNEKNFLVWAPTDWTALVTNPEFAGYVFLDEVNRSREDIVNMLLGFALDRMISGKKLSQQCFIAAAANLNLGQAGGSNFSGVSELDPAFYGRFNVGFLKPNAEEWSSWAQKNGVEQSIIDFVMMDTKKNFLRVNGANQQNVNPRNLQKASDNLKWVHKIYDQAIADAAKDGIENPNQKQLQPYLNRYKIPETNITSMTGDVYEDYRLSIVSRCGHEWTNEFMQYLRNTDEFEWEDVIEKLKSGHWKQKAGAKKAAEVDTSQLYYLVKYITNTLLSRYEDAKKNKNQAAFKSVIDDTAIAFAGLNPDQMNFLLNGITSAIKNAPGATQNQVATDMAELFTQVHGALKNTGNDDAVKKIADYIKLNKAAQAGGGLTEALTPKAVYNELIKSGRKLTFNEHRILEGTMYQILLNPRLHFKPRFKNFFKLNS